MISRRKLTDDNASKLAKFDFETMKSAATNEDPATRKKAFIEYFERFNEFPSYLFDNNATVDGRLLKTIQDLLKDEEITQEMHKGIIALIERLPSYQW